MKVSTTGKINQGTEWNSWRNFILVFSCGFIVGQLSIELNKEVSTEQISRVENKSSILKEGEENTRRVATNMFDNNGIFPILREMDCGHENLEVPRLLKVHPGEGRLVIDVGLGNDAAETKAAVDNGFNVIGFEPLPGNIENIKTLYQNDDSIRFIQLEGNVESGWKWPENEMMDPTLTTNNGKSIAYIVHAALGPKNDVADFKATGTSFVSGIGQQIKETGSIKVPVVALDDILPSWALKEKIYLWKIDTQGYELQVLKGAMNLLRRKQFYYIQYEFSPWLMQKNDLGDPDELVTLLPNMGSICFDMMVRETHNPLPHPTMPISEYIAHLNVSTVLIHRKDIWSDPYGPWDDITCYFPGNIVDSS